ncbi:MAG TPA: AI-2E family transporter [Verrucomicrobiae bacterium]
MEPRVFHPPSPKQARLIWMGVTALSVAMFLAVLAVIFWAAGWALQRLTPVLLPLAIAGIIAYLLDPLVDFLERKGLQRTWAILLVFLLGLTLVAGIGATVIPRLVVETKNLADRVPVYRESIIKKTDDWMKNSRWGQRFKEAWAAEDAWAKDLRDQLQGWASKAAPAISAWFVAQFSKIASWFGLIIGIAMVPVYLFYLLLEKQGISRGWTNYLPVHESRWKDETVFIIQQINDYLILFFRGQVLVALADGVLLTIGFLAIGLDYAFLLGMVAGLLSIVPFLGVAISIIPAIVLAVVQYGDWLHPALVIGVFAAVQFLEGFVISPKIMGDRVGLHPLTIILAVMIGTTLMGGIIGGILAIPLTAALRVLMFRYIWKRQHPTEPVPTAIPKTVTTSTTSG